MGPTVVSVPQKMEWHAGRQQMQRVGGTNRYLIGQLRDRDLNCVLIWAMKSPTNILRARMAARQYGEAYPHAEDWMERTPEAGLLHVPIGWTFPEAFSPIEQGMIV